MSSGITKANGLRRIHPTWAMREAIISNKGTLLPTEENN